ncbi:hypothetical protein FNV43_RR09469 [Rhamnella rubrinervis]|uniref:KHG/KDPG aldolase n=1 Tax=Rhamnella rubrinervis TaxID=2594499 RepID=A0A8K0HA13_9ROSA|nr:hypothetical protein FNV43_RR09469 [Rhamnella rubrinervis]
MVVAASLSEWPVPSRVLRRSSKSPPPRRLPQSVCCSSRVDETLSRIQSSGVIACLRADSAEMAMEAAQAALSGGISVLEIVVSTPGVFEVIQQLVVDHPATVFGVGTILNIEDAKRAINAGAKFLMSPAMVMNIMEDFQNGEVLYIPGVMTPTEILSAHGAGAKIVKVYPVSALGGIRYISALKKPFPHISMVASQGITIDSIGKYIDQGASSVVLSDAIFNKEALGQNNLNEIYQLASFAALQAKKAVECKRKCKPNFSLHQSVRACHAPFLQPHISLLKISLNRMVIREFQTTHVNSQMTNIPMYCPTHLLLQPLLCQLHVHNSLSYLGLGLPFEVCDQLAHGVLRSAQRLIRHNHGDHGFNRFCFAADIKMVTTVVIPDHFLGYQVTQRTHPTVTTSNMGDFINFNDDDQVIFDEVTSTERSPSPSPARWINRWLRPMDKLRKTEHEWVNTGMMVS